jgi:hypothetical protein
VFERSGEGKRNYCMAKVGSRCCPSIFREQFCLWGGTVDMIISCNQQSEEKAEGLSGCPGRQEITGSKTSGERNRVGQDGVKHTLATELCSNDETPTKVSLVKFFQVETGRGNGNVSELGRGRGCSVRRNTTKWRWGGQENMLGTGISGTGRCGKKEQSGDTSDGDSEQGDRG